MESLLSPISNFASNITDFWRKHRRSIVLTSGVVGSGYIFYRLYCSYKHKIHSIETTHDDDVARNQLHQMQAHFKNIQSISDSVTLQHALHHLGIIIEEELDISYLTDSLMMHRGQVSTLSKSEKREVWDRLKILSFTRMVLSLWAMAMLSLYLRVMVNILGRHLYMDTARCHDRTIQYERVDAVIIDLEKFLEGVDFLADHRLNSLISDIQASVAEVLNKRLLTDIVDTRLLGETITEIFELFMASGGRVHWVTYLMAEDNNSFAFSKLHELVVETREVLMSVEFEGIVSTCLKVLAEDFVHMMGEQQGGGGGDLSSGVPLAKLLPRIAQMGSVLVDESSRKALINHITEMPEVDSFFTILYSTIPSLGRLEEE